MLTILRYFSYIYTFISIFWRGDLEERLTNNIHVFPSQNMLYVLSNNNEIKKNSPIIPIYCINMQHNITTTATWPPQI